MRVILTHDIPCDTSRFLVRLLRRHAQLIHTIENPTVNWLETITNIRKGPSHDNTHCVIDETSLHFTSQINIY